MLYYKGLFLQGIMIFTTHISLSMDNPHNNDSQQHEEQFKRPCVKVGTREYNKLVRTAVNKKQISELIGKNLKKSE